MSADEVMKSYWGGISEDFSDVVKNEISTEISKIWEDVLSDNLPKKNDLEILDVGCGPGFFGIMLSRLGYSVTEADYNEKMLEQAKDNIKKYGKEPLVSYRVMSAAPLDYDDCAFDVVISRNVTWNLPDPQAAYKEWMRVLKPGGIIMNFDANWFLHYFDPEAKKDWERGEQLVEASGFVLRKDDKEKSIVESIKEMPLTKIRRPEWDVGVLEKYNAKYIRTRQLPSEIYDEYYRLLYNYIPTFMIYAQK